MKTIVGVTGYNGRLGHYLVSHFDNFIGLDCDVTQPNEIENCLQMVKPDVILHLAAKSDVDWCENESNAVTVSQVNLRGTFNVCVAAEKLHIEVILLSSDHVFSGNWGRYSEKSKPSPINQYGRSKLAAEALQKTFDNLRVVRTSYLFDADRVGNVQLDYPTFLIRSFMYIPHMAQSLIYYIRHISEMPKLLHIGGSERVSWYKFMEYMIKQWQGGGNIICNPRRTDNGKGQAPRPRNLGLDVSLSRRLGFPQFSYVDGIQQMLRDVQ